ncbi:DNA (cytosine-5)-methyltransferase 2 [Rhynchospora pubera]|uniref:DNA (Cytosine-5)-methyltransferase 2 n=1 Tax=Rhynchospora pubera TaxID=906938 RepID=A0AAV8G6T8_9POAL|nr:DNA (cytosine-5)-methyltransferase 2 [Rhynchospora pubera]
MLHNSFGDKDQEEKLLDHQPLQLNKDDYARVCRIPKKEFGPFKINYNTQKEKWKMSELIAMCVEEEERLKTEKLDFAHAAIESPKQKKNNGKGKNKNDAGLGVNKVSTSGTKRVFKCNHCKKPGHVRKECTKSRAWLAKKGIPFREDTEKGKKEA